MAPEVPAPGSFSYVKGGGAGDGAPRLQNGILKYARGLLKGEAAQVDAALQLDFQAILDGGVNLIDTAEQYPIPSDGGQHREGDTERIIGSWMAKDKSRREKVVIASKITGGRNINARSIVADCEGSLKRLGTDYMDVYLLHWPARYSPQSNWGQSLEYKQEVEMYSSGRASFMEIAEAMGGLIKAGKIRGWGMCNDNAYGLAASVYTSRALGVPAPCALLLLEY